MKFVDKLNNIRDAKTINLKLLDEIRDLLLDADDDCRTIVYEYGSSKIDGDKFDSVHRGDVKRISKSIKAANSKIDELVRQL